MQIKCGMHDLLSPDQVEALAAERGRSMVEVCRDAGIAFSTFSRWRAGETSPSIEVYRRLCTAAATVKSETKVVV
jgi:transcriptional regulator with XRE-family HTH domain